MRTAIEELKKRAPEKIYLQYFGDEDSPDLFDNQEIDLQNVTWHSEEIWKHDIEYVRSDLASRPSEKDPPRKERSHE